MVKNEDIIYVKKCLDGDISAFESLYDNYQKKIFNIVYRITNNYNDTCDITQNIFIKVYKNLEAYNPKYKFFSWIYRITINETLNYLSNSSKKTSLEHQIVSEQKNPEANCISNDLNNKIQSALNKLTPDYRIVMILRHLHELTYEEISHILEIPEKRVKSRLFSARQELKKTML